MDDAARRATDNRLSAVLYLLESDAHRGVWETETEKAEEESSEDDDVLLDGCCWEDDDTGDELYHSYLRSAGCGTAEGRQFFTLPLTS